MRPIFDKEDRFLRPIFPIDLSPSISTVDHPVDLSPSIPTVDQDQPTGEYGRYRRSITINLRRNTVDIDGRSGSTYGELGRSSMSTGSIEGVGSVDMIDVTGAIFDNQSCDRDSDSLTH